MDTGARGGRSVSRCHIHPPTSTLPQLRTTRTVCCPVSSARAWAPPGVRPATSSLFQVLIREPGHTGHSLQLPNLGGFYVLSSSGPHLTQMQTGDHSPCLALFCCKLSSAGFLGNAPHPTVRKCSPASHLGARLGSTTALICNLKKVTAHPALLLLPTLCSWERGRGE